MRTAISTLAITAILFGASTASAVTFTIVGLSNWVGNPPNAIGVPFGEEFTIDVRVSADADEVMALGASVYGYDPFVAQFGAGEAVDSIFHDVAIPGVGAFNGLNNSVSGRLSESSIGANGNRVQIFDAAQLSSFSAQSLDPGLDGIIGGGDAQFRLTFVLSGLGKTTLTFGTGYEGDGVYLASGEWVQANSASITVYPTPEPGTALLIGLGLAGLATTRGR